MMRLLSFALFMLFSGSFTLGTEAAQPGRLEAVASAEEIPEHFSLWRAAEEQDEETVRAILRYMQTPNVAEIDIDETNDKLQHALVMWQFQIC
ncbi:MAG: hypothetical protein H6618_09085 [Deltaproteobacteria bacterium]|nr:hypothetical protein [Deltaproteobacteria bacterium]